MGRPKQFTVKHFLNKKLPPQLNNKGQNRYPLYIRLRYDGRGMEIRSFVSNLSNHISLKHPLTDFISEVEMWKYDFYSKEEFENLELRKVKVLNQEIELIHSIFSHYHKNGFNLLKENTKQILEIHFTPLFVALDKYLMILLREELNANIEYWDIKKLFGNFQLNFSTVFEMLSKISNDKISSTRFYKLILKPFESYYSMMRIVYDFYTLKNLVLVSNYQLFETKIIGDLRNTFPTEEVEKCAQFLHKTIEFYENHIPSNK